MSIWQLYLSASSSSPSFAFLFSVGSTRSRLHEFVGLHATVSSSRSHLARELCTTGLASALEAIVSHPGPLGSCDRRSPCHPTSSGSLAWARWVGCTPTGSQRTRRRGLATRSLLDV